MRHSSSVRDKLNKSIEMGRMQHNSQATLPTSNNVESQPQITKMLLNKTSTKTLPVVRFADDPIRSNTVPLSLSLQKQPLQARSQTQLAPTPAQITPPPLTTTLSQEEDKPSTATVPPPEDILTKIKQFQALFDTTLHQLKRALTTHSPKLLLHNPLKLKKSRLAQIGYIKDL